MAKWLTRWSAKPVFMGSTPIRCSNKINGLFPLSASNLNTINTIVRDMLSSQGFRDAGKRTCRCPGCARSTGGRASPSAGSPAVRTRPPLHSTPLSSLPSLIPYMPLYRSPTQAHFHPVLRRYSPLGFHRIVYVPRTPSRLRSPFEQHWV